MNSTNTVRQRCCYPGQTNFPSSFPTAMALSPLPIPHSVASLCCLHVDAQAETCRCQDKAGLVSLSIHSSPCMEKTRHKSLHGSFFPPQLGCELTSHNQLLGFGSLSAMGTGLFSPFAPSIPLGCQQQVLILIWLVLGCHIVLQSANQSRLPWGLAEADANPAWDALLPEHCHPLPPAQIEHMP